MVKLTSGSIVNEKLFSRKYLEERLPETKVWKQESEARDAFDSLKKIYDDNKKTIRSSDKNGCPLKDDFVKPILERVLNHCFLSEAAVQKENEHLDYVFFKKEREKTEALQDGKKGDFYDEAIAVGDVYSWGEDLDKKSEVKDGFENSNPSIQIDRSLKNTSTTWGILSNGKKWRLYNQERSHRLDNYFEVDLFNILKKDDLESFKYFYFLFNKDAFIPKEDSFLDKVYEQSDRYSEKVGEELEENVYKALLWMAEGFFKMPSNDLKKTEENLDFVHENSLIFLYRLLFLFYAESKRSLPSDLPEPYEDEYSFSKWVDDILEEKNRGSLSEGNGIYHQRLSKIFDLINKGSECLDLQKEDLYISAYNGGLFNPEKHPFLEDKIIQDDHLAKVVELLANSGIKENEWMGGRIDYSDLSLRHIGGIYEGLLEYDLKIASKDLVAERIRGALKWIPIEKSKKDFDSYDEDLRVKEGDIYLSTDKGERRATGSYYTPDHIVEHIVESSIDPIIDEKIKTSGSEDEAREGILSIDVLDPAMGSGHFLLEVIDYMATRIAGYAPEGKVEDERDIDRAKREVANNCVYGVDINPLATELAKVTVWLNTIEKDKTSSFIDHHLKTGNSLIGADIRDIDKHPEEKYRQSKGQSSLTNFFDTDVRSGVKGLLEIYAEIVDVTEEKNTGTKKEEVLYKEFEEHPLRERLKTLADVYTSYHFLENYTVDDYDNLLNAFKKDPERWEDLMEENWIKSAKEIADEKNFFHWSLEFPEVSFDLKELTEKADPSFDAVIGNPPWNADLSKTERDYMRYRYPDIEGNLNTAVIFMELSIELSKNECAYIIPKSLCYSDSWKGIRNAIVDDLIELLDAGMAFKDVLLEGIIARYSKKSSSRKIETGTIDDKGSESYKIEKDVFKDLGIFFTGIDRNNLEICLKMLKDNDERLSDYLKIERGKLLRSYTKKDGEEPVYRGKNISRFRLCEPDRFLGKDDLENFKERLKYMRKPKLLIQNIVAHIKTPTDHIELMSFKDDQGHICNDTVSCGFPKNNADLDSLNSLLNSKLISWYAYRLVYSKAIRTMHFDNVHLERIPVNKDIINDPRLAEISKKIQKVKDELHGEKNNFLEWVENEWSVKIDNLSLKTHLKEYWRYDFDEIMRIAKKNKTLINKNIDSRSFKGSTKKEWKISMEKIRPMIDKIDDLENKLDAFVFKLYGLTSDEVKTILDDLSVDDGSKEDIMLKFKEIES